MSSSYLVSVRRKVDQLQNTIVELKTSHQTELNLLNQHFEHSNDKLTKTHEQQLNEYQQKLDQLLVWNFLLRKINCLFCFLKKEKTEVDVRCGILQEKVDGFLTEMGNSEHADVLLCHVETLEKDRTSLQTVLELKTKEVTQLRTKVSEQAMRVMKSNEWIINSYENESFILVNWWTSVAETNWNGW